MSNPESTLFERVAEDIREMLRLNEADATAKGEKSYYDPKFLDALYPFLESPSSKTSIPLLKTAPQFQRFLDLHMEYGKVLGPAALKK